MRTVIGTSDLPAGRLFTFGDVDGNGQACGCNIRWASPITTAALRGRHLQQQDQGRRSGQGHLSHAGRQARAGATDDPAAFDEPAGLAYAGGTLYVADTNNHAIRTIDLKNTNRVATLEIKGLAPPETAKSPATPSFADAHPVTLPAVTLKPADGQVRLRVTLKLPAGYKINPLAPLRYLVEADGNAGPIDREAIGKLAQAAEPAAKFDIELPASAATGSDTLHVSLGYYYCQEGSEGVCKAGSVRLDVARHAFARRHRDKRRLAARRALNLIGGRFVVSTGRDRNCPAFSTPL